MPHDPLQPESGEEPRGQWPDGQGAPHPSALPAAGSKSPPRSALTGPFVNVVLCAALGHFLGRITSWLLWQYMYSVGFRMISDEDYEELGDDVFLCGSMVGTCVGLAIGACGGTWRMVILLGAQGAGLVAGSIAAQGGWKWGMGASFLAQIAFGLAVVAAWWRGGRGEASDE